MLWWLGGGDFSFGFAIRLFACLCWAGFETDVPNKMQVKLSAGGQQATAGTWPLKHVRFQPRGERTGAAVPKIGSIITRHPHWGYGDTPLRLNRRVNLSKEKQIPVFVSQKIHGEGVISDVAYSYLFVTLFFSIYVPFTDLFAYVSTFLSTSPSSIPAYLPSTFSDGFWWSFSTKPWSQPQHQDRLLRICGCVLQDSSDMKKLSYYMVSIERLNIHFVSITFKYRGVPSHAAGRLSLR